MQAFAHFKNFLDDRKIVNCMMMKIKWIVSPCKAFYNAATIAEKNRKI